MQKINVPILGLTDSSEARAVRDGECAVLHNLTIDKGGVKVIAPPTKRTAVESSVYDEYYHQKADRWLSVRTNGVYNNSNNERINVIDGQVDGAVKSLAFMGNMVVMYCADGTVRYAIFDGNYRYLGRLPELPKLNVSIEPVFINTLTDGWYFRDNTDVSEKDIPLLWGNASKGFFDVCLAGLYQQGAYIDRTMIRMAARLFDGSYVAYSPIYYIEDKDEVIEIGAKVEGWPETNRVISRDNGNFISVPESSGDKSKFFTAVRGFIPTIDLEPYNFGRWKDIIVAIDVFAVPSIMGHKSTNEVNISEAEIALRRTDGVYGTLLLNEVSKVSYERYVAREASEIKEEIANAAQYYKIAEYDIEGKLVWKLKNTAPSQMAVQKSLPLNESPHEVSSTNQRYLYNSKLHLAGVTTRLCDPYAPYECMDGAVIVQVTTVVTLAINGKENKTISTMMNPKLAKKGDNYCLPPLLIYPDARATKMEVYVGYNTGVGAIQSSVHYIELPLKAHNTLNYAYYMADVTANADGIYGLEPIEVTVGVGSDKVTLTEANGILQSFKLNAEGDNRVFEQKNVMRLSEVDNPLFYPAKSTYMFDGDIMAVCSNTTPISQGQFGQHPLYVFTEDGVWVMTVDASGVGSYLSQVPCSREKCINGRGVTATTYGVVFPTSMGLMIISGTETVNISDGIAGLDTPELRKTGDAVERICGIVGKEAIRNIERFTDYLQGAFVAFDHNTDLLYVCNDGYNYVYVYNMASQAWSSADGNYSARIEYNDRLILHNTYVDGPERYHVRCEFDNYDKNVENVPVVMVTRGCIFGTTGFKRVGRSALRATFFSDRLGFYLLGSRDGVAWEVICGRECTAPVTRAAPPADNRRIVRDLVCRSLSSRAYKYITFAFAGTVRGDARFALIECEVGNTFEGIR